MISTNEVNFQYTTILNKYLGNPIQKLIGLNAALYWHKGKREKDLIKEIIPVWDDSRNGVKWIEREIKPSPKYVKTL